MLTFLYSAQFITQNDKYTKLCIPSKGVGGRVKDGTGGMVVRLKIIVSNVQ